MPEIVLGYTEVTNDEEIHHVVKLLDDDFGNGRVVIVNVEGVDDSPGDLAPLELDVLLGSHDGSPDDLGLAAVGAVPPRLARAAIRKLTLHAALVDATAPAEGPVVRLEEPEGFDVFEEGLATYRAQASR